MTKTSTCRLAHRIQRQYAHQLLFVVGLTAACCTQAQDIPAAPVRPALPPGVISGQQPLTPGQRDMTLDQNRFEREQQQERIDRALNQDPGADLAVPAVPEPPPAPIEDTGHRVTLSGVDLDFGVKAAFFNPEKLMADYFNRPLDNKGIFAMVRLLTAKIYEAGYITSTIGLGEPAVVKGRLQLKVHWGRIKGWRINGEPLKDRRDRTMVGWAMPNWRNDILNIRDIDQAIENLNNGYKRATIAIAPSADFGYSVLELTVERTSWLRLSVGRDNSGHGAPAYGRDKYNVSLQTGDLLGINDTLSLFSAQRYYADRKNNGENAYDVSYRIPLGYTRIDLQTSYSDYKGLIKTGGGQDYQSSGNTRSMSLRLTRTLYRDARSQFSVYGALRSRANENYLADNLISVSSKKYSDGTLGLQWSTQLGRHAWFTDLGWNRGLSINQGQYSAFGAFDATGYANRVNGTVSWQSSFAPLGRLLVAQSQFGFQYSRQMLLNSYQLILGDEYTVRGYNRRASQYGDKGMYLSNTLSMPVQFPWLGRSHASISPFVGFDVGTLRINAPGAPSVRMAGWALGSRFSFPYFNVAATYSKPIYTGQEAPKTPVWYVTSSVNF